MLSGHLTVKNGYWYAILMVKGEDGRAKQKWVALHLKERGNKRKAEAMLLELRQTYHDEYNPINDADGVLFSSYLKSWLKRIEYKVAPSTYSGYQSIVLDGICPYFEARGCTLGTLHARDLQEYYDSLLQRGLSANSVRRHHANIHKALREAVQMDLIRYNPAERVTLPSVGKPVNDCYSLEEAKQLLKAAEGTKLELPIFFALFYGLRRSEVLGLRWGAVDLVQNTMNINHTVHFNSIDGKYQLVERDQLKRHASARRFPLVDVAKDYLLAEKQRRYGDMEPDPDDYICVDEQDQVLRPNYVTQGFKKLLKKNGLREIRFHDLRHTSANLLITSGLSMVQVQHWLGHSSISTTIDMYSHLTYEDKFDCMDTLKKT